jgi:hypothetical protein
MNPSFEWQRGIEMKINNVFVDQLGLLMKDIWEENVSIFPIVIFSHRYCRHRSFTHRLHPRLVQERTAGLTPRLLGSLEELQLCPNSPSSLCSSEFAWTASVLRVLRAGDDYPHSYRSRDAAVRSHLSKLNFAQISI